MKLEYQVCSLEIAKKLLTLGVKQNSLFYWILFKEWDLILNGKQTQEYYKDCISAFTVAELFDLMPLLNGCPCQLIKGATLKNGILYGARYDCLEIDWEDNVLMADKNSANALAKMLIYLYENNLILKEKNDER